MNVWLRISAVAVVFLTALAIEKAFVASYQTAPVEVAPQGDTRTQKAMGRVVSVQPPVEESEGQEDELYNPIRGRPHTRLFPCAAEVLTGENRGRVVAFVNRVRGRPHIDMSLRPGVRVLLYVTTEKGKVVNVEAPRPLMRWRPLLWSSAILTAVLIAALGTAGVRAVFMTLGCGAALLFLTAPLLANGFSPPLVALISFAAVSVVMFLVWGGGRRATACAAAGALGGLLIAGVVAFAGSRLLGLTGESFAVIRLLRGMPKLQRLDFGQLLIVGMAIVAMGAAIDIAASVVSGLIEFRRANPAAGPAEVRRTGLQLNRNISATMVMTLCMAWLALRLPILMIAYRGGEALGKAWMKCYAAELLQIVSAAIAVMLAGPASAMLFSIAFAKREAIREFPTASSRGGAAVLQRYAALIVLVSTAVVSGGCLWRSRLPEKELSLDLSEVRSETSLQALQFDVAERQMQRDWDAAMLLLWRMRELAPRNPYVHRDLAYAYMTRRLPVLAHDSLERALPALEEDARTRYLAGVVAYWEGDYEAARRELQRAVELDPELWAAADALSILGP